MSSGDYTLDVNPTSSKRVKIRWYESRPVEKGGNVLLVQGQLSVLQFRQMERVLLAGARAFGFRIVTVGRYYTMPLTLTDETSVDASRVNEVRQGNGTLNRRPLRPNVPFEQTQPRAPGITGPVISPRGEDDDFEELARLHVERMLRRKAARQPV